MSGFGMMGVGDDRLVASTDRALALRQLREAIVEGADADRHRTEIEAFVMANPDAALRENLNAHLTGSAVVVDPIGERTLLLLHRKLGRWFQPGGHADGDTNLAAVALREAAEETGIAGLRVVVPAIDVDVHRVEPPGEPSHLHLDVRFLVLAPHGSIEQGNEESLALRWVDLGALDASEPSVDRSTRRLVERGLDVAAALGC